MTAGLFLAGDWGTSNLRLHLCQYNPSGQSTILDTRSGPGVSQVGGEFEETFFDLAGAWINSHGMLPIIISGMVGSTIGWREAPYLQCPIDAGQIAASRTVFEARGLEFSLIAGLKVKNCLGNVDVMRGEELQLLGWMQAHPGIGSASRVIALPGTHNKWALLKNGRIESFLTAFTGELFALLSQHSVLIADAGSTDFHVDAFTQGIAVAEELGQAQLVHALFSTRSRQVLGELSAAGANSYLSGLIVGSDVCGALALFRKMEPALSGVTLIGEPHLTQRYQLALERLGLQVEAPEPGEIAIAGFGAIYKHLYIEGPNR